MKHVLIEIPQQGNYHKWAETAQEALKAYGYDVEISITPGLPNWEIKGTEDEMNNAGILLSIMMDMHELESHGFNKVYRL